MTTDSQSSKSPHDQRGAPETGAPRTSYFGVATQLLNVVGTTLILLMVVAVNADVLGRNLFNHPIPGVLEFIGWSIVAIVFLQMANTLREGRHINNDILISMISRSHPRLVAGLFAAFDLIGAALMTMIVIYIWPLMMLNYREGFYAGTAGVVEIPIWPFMASVVIGAAATAMQFFVHGLHDLRRAGGMA